VFYLAYHLHWSRDDVMVLPTPERRRYLELLADELERQQKAVDDARASGAA